MADSLKKYEDKMKSTISSLNDRFKGIRAGRANPSVLDRIKINYFGQETPLNQVAGISVPEAKMITIQPWDASILTEIEKAIQKSDLGINPTNDGKIIRLVFPALTTERRTELTKDVKKMAEESKVAIRNIRRDAVDEAKKLEKSGEYTEDDRKSSEADIQKLTDSYLEQIDDVTKKKEEELMEI